MKGKDKFDTLLEKAKADAHVVGLVLGGSRGKGVFVEASDWDVTLVLKDDVPGSIHEAYRALDGDGLDLNVFTLSQFREHAAWGGAYAWDRYNYAHLVPLVDKMGGIVGKLVEEKGRLPPEGQREYVRASCDAFINQFYRALKCQTRGDPLAARLESAEGVGYLWNALFGLRGRLKPYYKYLRWELEKYPLESLPWTTDELLSKTTSLLGNAKAAGMVGFLIELEKLFRGEGFGEIFDSWGDDMKWMKSLAIPREIPAQIRNYLDHEGRLKLWPKKGHGEIMAYLAERFELGKKYSETEANSLLNEAHTFGDHALLRRELYNRGFLNRLDDGSVYWRVK